MAAALEKVDPSLPARALSVNAFEQQLGGRDVLFEILSQADKSAEIDTLLGLIGDPKNNSLGLAYLCRMANLQPGEVFIAYERALTTRAKVLARIPIAEALPSVAADAMRRAQLHKVRCEECRGLTELYTKQKDTGIITAAPCPFCQATGWVDQEPTIDQQKLALELGELLQKNGLTIQNAINQDNSKTVNVVGSMGSTLTRLQTLVADTAFGPDITVAPVATPGAIVDAD